MCPTNTIQVLNLHGILKNSLCVSFKWPFWQQQQNDVDTEAPQQGQGFYQE